MPKRTLQGTVVSNKADKTVTVRVDRRVQHKLYKKIISSSKKYTAHDETNCCKVGDVVNIIECAPISKRKSFTVVHDDKAAKQKEDK